MDWECWGRDLDQGHMRKDWKDVALFILEKRQCQITRIRLCHSLLPSNSGQESVFSTVFSSPSLQHYLCDLISSLIPLQVHWTPGCSWYLLSSLTLRFQFFSQMWPAQWVFSWPLYFKLEPPVFPLFPSTVPITIWHMITLFILFHYLPTCRKK